MTNHMRVVCPECYKHDKIMNRRNTMLSRDFRDHIIANHNKNYHKWFKKWSKRFFELHPDFLTYMGVVNKNYVQPVYKGKKEQTSRKLEGWEFQ